MTEKEIIKVLECCSNVSCVDGCPLNGEIDCGTKLVVNTLSLIKYQQEYIEDLVALNDLRSKRHYYSRFVNEVWQKERGKLSQPDFDEIYKRYFEQQERMDEVVKSLESQIDGYKEYYPEDYIFETYDMIDLCESIIKMIKGDVNDR